MKGFRAACERGAGALPWPGWRQAAWSAFARTRHIACSMLRASTSCSLVKSGRRSANDLRSWPCIPPGPSPTRAGGRLLIAQGSRR